MKSIAIFFTIALIFAAGCLSTKKKATLIDVPFIPQNTPNHCGVVAIKTTLDYYDSNYNPTNIAKEAFVALLQGTPLEIIAEIANKHNLTTERRNLDIEGLRNALNRKEICIIYLASSSNSPVGHFSIVTGITNNGKKIRIHGTQRANLWLPAKKLLKRSSNGKFPTLIISRPHMKKQKHLK
jgi:ABC-type bacteriocin/lantibiotic exporter with double-glycine peptidase domain